MASLDDLDIHTAARYGERGYPWGEWDRLRAEAPVYWYDRPGISPFWAISRYEDIRFVSSNDALFINGGPRLRLMTTDEDDRMAAGLAQRARANGWDPGEPMDFIFMDRPRHTKFRAITNRRFTPRAMRDIEVDLDEYAQRFTDEFVDVLERDGFADLVTDFAVKLPLATICGLMGLPVDDWATVHKYTDILFDTLGAEQWRIPTETALEQRDRMSGEFREYINTLIAERRAEHTDDLAGAVVHGTVDGCPLTAQQLNGYLFVLIAAGNETTRNATTRGITELLRSPDQIDRLLADDDLIDTAVEEMVRWTSPVIQFARTATVDVELQGQLIRAGDTVGVFYPSGNRDESVFENPYSFDVGRQPNHHLGFGHGVHFCLGANLARWELRSILRSVLPLLPRLELVGEPDRLGHFHVGAVRAQHVKLKG
ncbi:MAG: cytochrome P450 [Acidimicrobiales bacterium]